MEKEDLPASRTLRLVLQRQNFCIPVDRILAVEVRKTQRINLARPKITHDREQMRVSDKRLKIAP